MDITYFRTFREVARKQSFTRAAELLGYAQSSVTMQIQKLERDYGVPLFERYGRGLRLTPPGEALLQLVHQILELYDQSREIVADTYAGTLVIGTIDSLAAYFLPPYLQQMKRLYPELHIQLLTDSESSLIARVRDGELDAAFTLDQQPADAQLRCIPLREEPLVLAARPGHPLARSAAVELRHLEGADLIVTEQSCMYRNSFEQLLKEHGVACRIGFELGSLEAMKQCAINDLGIALMPRISVEAELRSGALEALAFAHPRLRIELQLLLHPKKWMSHTLQTLVELVCPPVSQPPG